MSPARCAYLGPAGTFAEAALATLPGTGVGVPVATVGEALAGVRDGTVDAALVPFENSLEGSVAGTLDDLARGSRPLAITREVLLAVSFALLARPGTGLGDIGSVATIDAAAAQCRTWLRMALPGVPVLSATSTAAAARSVAAGGDGAPDAAVAGPAAAAAYGLDVLAEGLEDAPGAVTRFVLVTRPGPPPPPTGADRTTVVLFERGDRPGALLEMLTEFAVRGVNLTRLESRPTGEGLGRYCFAVDLDGHVAEARVGEALSALHRVCAEVLVLGSYPRGDGRGPSSPRTGTGAADFADAEAWLARVRGGSAG